MTSQICKKKNNDTLYRDVVFNKICMSENFDPSTWLEKNGGELNNNYAEIKRIDPTLDAKKIMAIGDAIAEMKAKEVNSRSLDEAEATRLVNL